MNMLELRQIIAGYGNITALKCVDLDVPAGHEEEVGHRLRRPGVERRLGLLDADQRGPAGTEMADGR